MLVSQVEDDIPPHWMVNKIANTVFRVHLGYSCDAMIYLEDEIHGICRTLNNITFERFGSHGDRQILFRPRSTVITWADLEVHIGAGIALMLAMLS